MPQHPKPSPNKTSIQFLRQKVTPKHKCIDNPGSNRCSLRITYATRFKQPSDINNPNNPKYILGFSPATEGNHNEGRGCISLLSQLVLPRSCSSKCSRTPWKIKMEPENHLFAKENHLNQTFFLRFHVNLRGCTTKHNQHVWHGLHVAGWESLRELHPPRSGKCLACQVDVGKYIIPSGKLTWKSTFSNREYIFKGSIFHSYVSLPECTWMLWDLVAKNIRQPKMTWQNSRHGSWSQICMAN